MPTEPSPPLNLRQVHSSVTTSSVRLQWDAPDPPNGNITHFKVTCDMHAFRSETDMVVYHPSPPLLHTTPLPSPLPSCANRRWSEWSLLATTSATMRCPCRCLPIQWSTGLEGPFELSLWNTRATLGHSAHCSFTSECTEHSECDSSQQEIYAHTNNVVSDFILSLYNTGRTIHQFPLQCSIPNTAPRVMHFL